MRIDEFCGPTREALDGGGVKPSFPPAHRVRRLAHPVFAENLQASTFLARCASFALRR
jgi:hypothetical protein